MQWAALLVAACILVSVAIEWREMRRFKAAKERQEEMRAKEQRRRDEFARADQIKLRARLHKLKRRDDETKR